MMLTPESVLSIQADLGEGPIWSQDEKVLYWIDVTKPSINRFDPKTNINQVTAVNQLITSLVFTDNDDMLGTFEQGIAFVNPKNGDLNFIHDPYEGQDVICNDGTCDRKGRFWSGTAAKDWTSPIGKLLCLDSDLSLKVKDSNFILSNGLGFSPDDKTFYFTDFGRNTIYAYDFDLDSGELSHRKPFIVIPEKNGKPDGMTVDSEGCLWIAHWDGWCISRHDPAGKLMETIKMPIQRPTSVTFGGDNLSTLYITSARMLLTDDELKTQPLAGNLFALKTNTTGLPEAKFKRR